MTKQESIIKIGSAELYESEAERLYEAGKYIVTYSCIYQLQRGGRAYPHVYGLKIYSCKGMTRRGRFYALSANEVNDLVGQPLVTPA